MGKVTIFTKDNCIYCTLAKKLLIKHGYKYNEINVEIDPNPAQALEHMLKISKGKTFPQIILNGKPIGGYDDLNRILTKPDSTAN